MGGVPAGDLLRPNEVTDAGVGAEVGRLEPQIEEGSLDLRLRRGAQPCQGQREREHSTLAQGTACAPAATMFHFHPLHPNKLPLRGAVSSRTAQTEIHESGFRFINSVRATARKAARFMRQRMHQRGEFGANTNVIFYIDFIAAHSGTLGKFYWHIYYV